MKAIYCPRYGGPDILEIRDLPKPAIRPGHVLVRVRAANVSSGDARIRAARFPRGLATIVKLFMGLRGPRNPVLGFSFAGEVAELGQGVRGFTIGQRVVGITGQSFGAHAEFKLIRADTALVPLPDAVDDITATALTFGGTTAIDFLRTKGQIKAGERVLILGASGQVGSAMVQIAKLAGAHVTATCSGRNVEMVERLGADQVVDYTQQDITTLTDTFDIIADCVNASDYASMRPMLNPNGRHLMIDGELRDMLAARGKRDAKGRRSIGGVAADKKEYVTELVSLAAQGKFDPVVTATFPMEKAAEAHALIDSGRKVGSVVLTFA